MRPNGRPDRDSEREYNGGNVETCATGRDVDATGARRGDNQKGVINKEGLVVIDKEGLVART